MEKKDAGLQRPLYPRNIKKYNFILLILILWFPMP